jgi:hypothetical protein
MIRHNHRQLNVQQSRVRAGTSTNWSGYSAAGAPVSFTSVAASWSQPAVNCTTQSTYSSYWVGLDGDSTSTVEQLGTEADCVNGAPRYNSWYEMYPHPGYYATVTVVPGHSYRASVTFIGSGNYRLNLQDTTTGQSFTTTQKLASAKRASAEVIVEAPWSGGVFPLANFGTAQFSGAMANGTILSAPPADALTMVNSAGATKAKPSTLSGGNFSVAWYSSS